MKATIDNQAQVQPAGEKKLVVERPVLYALPSGQGHHREKPSQEASEATTHTHKFETRAFVFSCLQENPDLKLAEIRQRARASGQDLSESIISRYRKQFHASSAVHVVNADASSAMQTASTPASSGEESESAPASSAMQTASAPINESMRA